MSELSPQEKAFLDEAYQRLKTSRCTMTEKEAVRPALLEGYELKLSFDERFARAEARQGHNPPHWRLAEQTLANTRLLNELNAGSWDGRNLDEKLQQMDQEDQLHYIFYPHDPRMFQNRQGAWEVVGERQITLPLGLKEELDTFKDALQANWSEPLTIGQVLAMLEELGWQHASITSVHRCIRAWLLSIPEIRRVGPDYWIPVEQLPPEVQRTRFQVAPVRADGAASNTQAEESVLDEEQDRERQRGPVIFRGTATKTQVTWTATLRSVHLFEGFIPIPKAVRGVYPPTASGEESIGVLKGLWHSDAEELWLWLDRAHHRLYGPDLLDCICFLPAGTRLQIDWNSDVIVLREAGLDPEVQREETRLADPEEIKKLRDGSGESYRQAIQAILSAAPDGLAFKKIVSALSERQQHEVTRRTVRAILSRGGFIQHDQRWYAAPSNATAARQLKEALQAYTLPQDNDGEQAAISHNEHVRARVQAIRQRLQEIMQVLRENP